MQRPCCETGIVVVIVGCRVENLLLSSSMSSSASTLLCPEYYYSLILIQEQPTAKDVQSGSWHPMYRIKHRLCLKQGPMGIACSCFSIKVLKDERNGDADAQLSGLLYLQHHKCNSLNLLLTPNFLDYCSVILRLCYFFNIIHPDRRIESCTELQSQHYA